MRLREYLIIGLSSAALLYFSNGLNILSLSITINSLLFFIGIIVGMLFLVIAGNEPKRYHRKPFLFWLAYLNYFFVYPILKFLARKKEIKRSELSSFFTIIVLIILCYVIVWVLSLILPITPFSKEFINGILIGSVLAMVVQWSTPGGANPFFPLSKIRIFGRESSLRVYRSRLNLLILLPFSLIFIELILLVTSNPPQFAWKTISNFNNLALLLIWACFLYASGTLSSIKRLFRIPYPHIHQPPMISSHKAHFLSDVEKYNFEELNKERKKHGLSPLQFDNGYAGLSRSHSHAMAKAGKIYHGDNVHKTHGGFSGENCAMMVKGHVLGFSHTIKTEYDVAKALHRQWMKSPGHRQNMLTPGYNFVGIGVYRQGHRYYATQLFSS